MRAYQGQHLRVCISAGLLALMLTAGCSSSADSIVTGQVTFNGEPLDDAAIRYRPLGGGHGSGGNAEINSGTYKIDQLQPGDYSVWIMAQRKTGRKVRNPDGGGGKQGIPVEETIEIIPMQYNVRSTLKATLAPGENQQDFTLQK